MTYKERRFSKPTQVAFNLKKLKQKKVPPSRGASLQQTPVEQSRKPTVIANGHMKSVANTGIGKAVSENEAAPFIGMQSAKR